MAGVILITLDQYKGMTGMHLTGPLGGKCLDHC